MSKLSRDRGGILSISTAIGRDWHGEPHFGPSNHPHRADANSVLCTPETLLRLLYLWNDISIDTGYYFLLLHLVGFLLPYSGGGGHSVALGKVMIMK